MDASVIRILAGLYVIWNVITFGVMGFDKFKSKVKGRRVPEKNLLLFAFCLGGVGVFGGMHFFRHKTRHPKFTWGVPLSILANIVVVVGVWRLLISH